MYGKIFKQIYDSTLADDWQALVTFQQLIILCDQDGVVDMTPNAIHRVTNIPLDLIEHGLEKLQAPDKHSRSPNEGGRRIIPLDDGRNWGWKIVNYEYYRNLSSKEDKKQKDRIRIADKREKLKKNNDVATCSIESQKVANVAYTEAEADIKTNKTLAPDGAFDRFWLAYPKRKSKGQALKAWNKLKPNEQLQDRILHALERAKTSAEWRKDNGQFIPHPASWLNAMGWEDEQNTELNGSIFEGVT